MSEEKNELVEEKPKSFSVALSEKLTEVSGALPQDFNKDRFVQNALALLNDNKAIGSYKPQLIMQGLLKGAYLGCDFFNKEAWLIPYGQDLQFQLSYKGEVKLAKKYSTKPIAEIYARVVRQGDEFQEKIVDGKPTIDFKPINFNTGAIIGAFAIVLYQDGTMNYDVMSVNEIENTRKNSSKSGNVWKNYYEEMCRKTVLKRLCKHIDMDMENPTQIQTYQSDMAVTSEGEDLEVVDAFEDEVVDTVVVDVE